MRPETRTYDNRPKNRVAVYRNGVVVNVIARFVTDPIQADEVIVERAERGDEVLPNGNIRPGPGNAPDSADKGALIKSLRALGKWDDVRAAIAAGPADLREDWDAATVIERKGDLMRDVASAASLNQRDVMRAFKGVR